jgi:hypothetical protein
MAEESFAEEFGPQRRGIVEIGHLHMTWVARGDFRHEFRFAASVAWRYPDRQYFDSNLHLFQVWLQVAASGLGGLGGLGGCEWLPSPTHCGAHWSSGAAIGCCNSH